MFELNELEDLDFGEKPSSSGKGNFGGGLELLMNDKAKEGSSKRPTADIDLDELNDLENDLNNLVDDAGTSNIRIDSGPSVSFQEEPMLSFDMDNLGRATAQTDAPSTTWDGYGKFNNIPMNPDRGAASLEPKLTKEETMKAKFALLRKFEEYEKAGIQLSKKYSMDDPLSEMQSEDDSIVSERKRKNAVKFQSQMLMTCINGLEWLNEKFDPFDVKLDGWSQQVQENISEYDDVFAELYEKYKGRASMAPELKLLFQLGGSALMVHMSNTMFKSQLPNVDDIFRQNPDIMRSFQNAAVSSMAQQSPGLAGFMNNIMNPEPPRGQGPPPPVATQGPGAPPPPRNRAGNNDYAARPDLSASRGGGFPDLPANPRSARGNANGSSAPPRAEMVGPSDIGDILASMKTRTINIQQPVQAASPSAAAAAALGMGPSSGGNRNDDSVVSLTDLKEISADMQVPKKSGRRKKSAANTVSLDI